jgi:L-lactate dehydrogenase complex protein LldG
MPTFKTSSAKENILKKIRIATQENKVDMPYPELGKVATASLYNSEGIEDLPTLFAQNFQLAGGKFAFCKDINDFVQQLNTLSSDKEWRHVACAHKDLFTYLINNEVRYIRDLDVNKSDYDCCITDCELVIARTGSFIFSSKQNFGRTAPIYYPVHIVVIQPHQVVFDISDGLKLMQQKYQQSLPSMLNLNTGPSRTADIEKTLVTGVHGPKEIYCFWIEN